MKKSNDIMERGGRVNQHYYEEGRWRKSTTLLRGEAEERNDTMEKGGWGDV